MAVSVPAGILHLSSTSGPGGAEMIVRRLAASLDPQRFRSVACLFRPGWLQDACQLAGLPTHVLRINGAFDLQWARAFLRLIKTERIALIHAHEFTANVYGTMLGRIADVPVVATIHGKNYYWEQAKRRIAYRIVSRKAKMIAVSHDLKQFVVERVGIPAHRIEVVYNGVEAYSPPDIDQVQAAQGELELSRWDYVVGSVGSLYPVKGHIYLIQALPLILQECPKTVLLLVGRGESENVLKAEVSRLGVEDHVRFLGFRNDISVLLGLMDVFVLPSLSEGLSMALLEAMSAGRPIVATKVGGNAELVYEGQTGYLVPSEAPQALAERVVCLLGNKDQAMAFGGRGKQLVEEQFSLAGMVNAYQKCYERAIEE
jgi:glycosyltransferase involved in cell wall biosynthesis